MDVCWIVSFKRRGEEPTCQCKPGCFHFRMNSYNHFTAAAITNYYGEDQSLCNISFIREIMPRVETKEMNANPTNPDTLAPPPKGCG